MLARMWELYGVIMTVHLTFDYKRSYALLPKVRNRWVKEPEMGLFHIHVFWEKKKIKKPNRSRQKKSSKSDLQCPVFF